MCDLVLRVENDRLLASKVNVVVRDDGVEEPEEAHYVLPKELNNLLPGDLREWHCLELFGEVVGGHQ